MKQLDTNHRWLVWREARGDRPAHPVAAFDEEGAARALAARSPRLTVKEHLAWLPTTTVRVRRLDLNTPPRLGQIWPPDGDILVCDTEAVGRGMVIAVGDFDFAVAVPVLPPAIADGPSLWSLGRALAARSAQA
jgi:hypothetical protein